MSTHKSTIVRSIQLSALRALFGTLERLAPGPGSRLAERLWCTVPRARARPPEVAGERFTLPVHGRAVQVEAWGEGPAVYLLHGWGGWRGQLSAFVAPLVAAGHRVVAFDAPGHGDSAPGAYGRGRALLPEFADALAVVVAACGPAYAVVGHSLGGAAAAIAVLDGLPTSRLVLISPMADPAPYTREFARELGFGERIRTGFLRILSDRVRRPMADFDVPTRARGRADLPPLLVAHDDGDRNVHPADAVAITRAWAGGTLLRTTGLGHLRILRDAATVYRALDFLVEADAGLPA